MAEQKRFPWWIVGVGIGLACILCMGVVVVGGGAAYFLSPKNAAVTTYPEPPAVTVEVETSVPNPTPVPGEPTVEPAPTEPRPVEPTLSEPTQTTDQELTGGQRVDEHSLYDDFSSDALGWPTADDGSIVLAYENEAYRFQVIEPDYYDWAYFPVDFTPYEIAFNVQGPAGDQDGTFGVFCQFQDPESYYFVEFDLADNTYLIGQYRDGEYTRLSEESDTGQDWLNTSALHPDPSAVNHIAVSCYLDSVTLFINDEWVNSASVSQPFDQPGDAAFFVYAFDFAGEDGYQVYFDNVEVWQPVQ